MLILRHSQNATGNWVVRESAKVRFVNVLLAGDVSTALLYVYAHRADALNYSYLYTHKSLDVLTNSMDKKKPFADKKCGIAGVTGRGCGFGVGPAEARAISVSSLARVVRDLISPIRLSLCARNQNLNFSVYRCPRFPVSFWHVRYYSY